MLQVRAVKAESGHRLALSFSDGTSGVADLSAHMTRAPFNAVADESVFRRAIVEHGAVEWPGTEVGISTEALYALAHGLPKPRTLQDVRSNEAAVSRRGG
jgi:hypothetical protein